MSMISRPLKIFPDNCVICNKKMTKKTLMWHIKCQSKAAGWLNKVLDNINDKERVAGTSSR